MSRDAVGPLNSLKKREQVIEIALLADHPETIPTLAQWFRAQWPEYYAGRTLADIAQDFHAETNHDRLPVRLVAFADGELAGTITLRVHALQALPEYRPGLGGLLVVEQQRGRGIGTGLVHAGMHVARAQGYAAVYTVTATAGGILWRLGWQRIQQIEHGDEHLVLYSCDLEPMIDVDPVVEL